MPRARPPRSGRRPPRCPRSAPTAPMAQTGSAQRGRSPGTGDVARRDRRHCGTRRERAPSVSAARQPEPESRPELEAMTLMEHLRELRSRIIKCLLAILVGAIVMWFFYNPAFRWLADQLKRTCAVDQQCEIIQTNPLQGFSTRMTFAGYGGLALAMPVILWQLWRFIMPGLYPRERRLAWPFTISAVLLFVAGATVSLWTLPK